MKKRYLFLITCLCFLVLAGGCKKKNTVDDLVKNGDDTEDTTDEIPVKEDYKASDYVTLGEYKGIEVAVERYQVTDGIVDMAIEDQLESKATKEEVTDRAVMSGDTVNIDYEGLKDGVAFDGGTAKGVDLVIGSGQFIPGFEDGLIGANIGDKVTLNLTFPEKYPNNPDLAGQAVVFNVTVNSISETKVPELTEDYVKENTEYDSIEAFREATRKQLQEISDENFESDRQNNVLQAVIDNSKFSSIPQSLLDYYAYVYRNYMEKKIYSSYGVSLEDYLSYLNMTNEDFEKVVSQASENQAKAEMVEKAIADAEGIAISDDEYNELLADYMSDRGISSEDDLRKYETKEQTIENMRMQKALDYVVSAAVIKEKVINETTQSDTAAEDETQTGADKANEE